MHNKIIMLFASIGVSSICAMAPDVISGACLEQHETNLGKMVDAAYSMPQWQENNAAVAYVAAYKQRFNREQEPKRLQDIFDQETCGYVSAHYATVRELPEVLTAMKAFQKTDSQPYDATQAAEFRKKAAQGTMTELQKVNVHPAKKPGNTVKGHRGFLKANKYCTDDQAKHMLAGSFLLASIQVVSREPQS